MGTNKEKSVGRSAVIGVVALVFLIIGYQTALFVHSAAVAKIASNRDAPDTVYVTASSVDVCEIEADAAPDVVADREKDVGRRMFRKQGQHTKTARAVRDKLPRRVESFRFNPNTVSKDDLQRLGFSEKQAQSIINYREKGGRFRRKSDFAKSFVVSDSVYRRLEPYIAIPKIDLNQADSADFDSLPGIGGWFAARMVAYRSELGGYSCKEQLMDIYRFDRERFDALKDLVVVKKPYRYPLWKLSADSLRMHPYIRNYETARAIVLFRENNPPEKLTVDDLCSAGVLTRDDAIRLGRCVGQ